MRFFALITLAFLSVFALTAQARTRPGETPPRPSDGTSPWVTLPAEQAKSLVDTLYIMGGPGSYDGSFETAGGQPDWHGWTHKDLSVQAEGNHWHVSTYWAEYIEGLGIGNHALYCGDETIPACDPPDTIGGIGPSYFDDIEWHQSVADPSQPVTVRLTGLMNYDLPDAGWDFLELYLTRAGEVQELASWTGTTDTTVTLDFEEILFPGDYTGPAGDEVHLFWRVWTSDDGWDDEDCLNPSHGACQIDNLAVFFDNDLITFDDFESGESENWIPVTTHGVGDFTHLRNDLGDADPCRDNNTWQVNFVDNGLVVPGTGGTPCLQHCYDPGGWIVNNTGGLLDESPQTWFLHNMVTSPPIAWVPGNDGAELSFDVYKDEQFNTTDDAGVFYGWHVRSTISSDPADLEDAPWRSQGGFFYGGPEYIREIHSVGHLIVPNCQLVQIGLTVHELGWQWGINGPNGTPAPYFDNVAFKIWDPDGPGILVENSNLFADAFPEAGALNPDDLAANWCRVDIQGTPYVNGQYAQGDSLQVYVAPMRHGADIPEPALLHWVMACNPTFDGVRSQAPDGQGLVRGMVTGSEVYDAWGNPMTNVWSFDLPDTGFFYPGDRIHYYLTAKDDLEGDVRTSVWPPDTTGVLDFTLESPFPRETTASALPTLTQPTAGEFSHPGLLFCDGTIDQTAAAVWYAALQELGYVPGSGFDVMTVHKGGETTGLGALTTVDLLAEYQILLYSSGAQSRVSLAGNEEANDALLVSDWLATGQKQALMAGDFFSYGLGLSADGSALRSQLGVEFHASDITVYNGNARDLQASPVPGGGVIPDHILWQVYAGCPDLRYFDAIDSYGLGRVTATLDPQGIPGGPYAALVTVDNPTLVNRTAVMPFDLAAVTGMTTVPGKDGASLSAQAQWLTYMLFWLAADGTSSVGDLPGFGQIAVSAHPNPFNPTTNIAFDLPRAMEVSLDIFDLQGRMVRRLLDKSPYTAGRHHQVWDGRDASGQNTASGVYFFRFTAGDQNRVGKLTLLK